MGENASLFLSQKRAAQSICLIGLAPLEIVHKLPNKVEEGRL